jgi:endonuclease G
MKILYKITLLVLMIFFTACGGNTRGSGVQIDTSSNYYNTFVSHSVCSEIIDKTFFTICYDTDLKVAKSVAYTLSGDLVNELNIQNRPSFYEEPTLANTQRANFKDYINSGYDRGHLAPDASFDWSEESLASTYSLANIIPQVPKVNRELWVDVEQYARTKAVSLGKLNVINVLQYPSNPNRIGSNGIAVSTGYYKILYNEDESYEECFYYANNNASQNTLLANHEVSCSSVGYVR